MPKHVVRGCACTFDDTQYASVQATRAYECFYHEDKQASIYM